MFGHQHAGISELLDVGDVVVLCKVDSHSSSKHERESASDYTHSSKTTQFKLDSVGRNRTE